MNEDENTHISCISILFGRLSEEARCRVATRMSMKMGYTARSGESTEVGERLVLQARGRKLTGVRPECLIVATCVSREHAKETCG